MNSATIANASGQIEALSSALDNAYWEASTIDRKDLIYSIITLLNAEIIEISKLSIQDHDLPYEPISSDFSTLKTKLNTLNQQIDSAVIRHSTCKELQRLIPSISSMLL